MALYIHNIVGIMDISRTGVKVKIADKETCVSKSDPGCSELTFNELLPVLLIAGSGFLVDVYDVVLFSVVRIASLTSLGVLKTQMLSTGIFLLNMQLVGMILGGFLWGILGDKKDARQLYSAQFFFIRWLRF